jgi:RNA polymerase sigma-70 factor (ECF subfamily)
MDEAAFRTFYEETKAALYAYLRRAGGDPALAEDLVQEAYIRILRHGSPGFGAAERRAFLYRIATNLLYDRWRRERRERGLLAHLFSGREPTAEPSHARLDLETGFSALRPRDRALLWLAHAEERPHREIAAILGLSEAGVRVLLFRARRRLAAVLNDPRGKQP